MQRVLLSGFEPFDGMSENTSRRIVLNLEKERFSGAEVRCVVLPVVFDAAFQQLEALIEEIRPHWVISFGLDRRAKELHLERIAANWIDAKKPDNRGDQPRARKISDVGPDGIFSSLPLVEIYRTLQAEGSTAEITNMVGDHLCNFLFYQLMRKAQAEGFRAGFVHVPAIPEMLLVDTPTKDLATLTLEARRIVEICLATK